MLDILSEDRYKIQTNVEQSNLILLIGTVSSQHRKRPAFGKRKKHLEILYKTWNDKNILTLFLNSESVPIIHCVRPFVGPSLKLSILGSNSMMKLFLRTYITNFNLANFALTSFFLSSRFFCCFQFSTYKSLALRKNFTKQINFHKTFAYLYSFLLFIISSSTPPPLF